MSAAEGTRGHLQPDRDENDPNRFLYHGTLRRNIPSIRDTGLRPQSGAWAGHFHPDAAALVYAVDDEHRSAAILAIAGQMAKAGLIRDPGNCSFDDFKNALIEHGTVVVVKATTFRRYPWSFESGHPTGAEPGNWYSSESVSIEREMIGREMLDWLNPSGDDFIYRYALAIRECLLRANAYHEGGHAIVAWALDLSVLEILIRDDRPGEHTKAIGDKRLPLIDQVAICKAGRQAEEVFENRLPRWASLQGDDVDALNLLAANDIRGAEAERWMTDACARSKELLTKHADEVHRLAARLIQCRHMDVDEFKLFMQGRK